jgi:non-specific serine/threonine protein kinase/serine/threonine-protein kinase
MPAGVQYSRRDETMSSEQFQRAKQIFLAACSLPPEDRHALLDAECGDDAALRREVEELLAFHEEQGTGVDPVAEGAAQSMPQRIGGYRVIRKLGEGGMGEVYEAEQTDPVRRLVALKVIKWGMDTKEVVARFESERQALALMDHSNIARVFEAGATEQGRPYFAMEYVKGIPITDFCDNHRLDTRERLELFAKVCLGVQHAHRKGVIHRDLKPSNILVGLLDDRPVPKIIDFGVAKATSQRLTERTVITELGQWIGTPEYMSPEQAEMTGLDIDTRTDVYSLGVVLYELLSGVTPFDPTTLRAAGFDEMRRRIREEEPQRPSTRVSGPGSDTALAAERRRTDQGGLARQLRGDLDWIVMRALEKDRTRRYGSPAELAADISRHLRSEAVEASPPSTGYLLRKFVRRNRVAVVTATMVVAALVIGIVGVTVGLIRARSEAESARKVAEFIEGMFEQFDPGRSGGASTAELVDRAQQRVQSDLGDQPLVQARLLTTLGSVNMGLGRLDEARPLLDRALAIRRELLGADHPELSRTLSRLGWWHYRVGEYDEAERLTREALRIVERTAGPQSLELAWRLRSLARVLWVTGRFDEARTLYERALSIAEQTLGPDHRDVADILRWYGILMIDVGEYRVARRLGERCIAIYEAQPGLPPADLGWTLTEYGRVLHYLGEYERAEAAYRRSWRILGDAFGEAHPDLGLPVSGLANLLRTLGRFDESRRLFEHALEIREAVHGPVHLEVLWSLSGYGWLLYDTGDIEAAREVFERAVEMVHELFPGGYHVEGYCRTGLGATLAAAGDRERAVGELLLAIALSEESYGVEHERVGLPHMHLGEVLAEGGDCQRGRQHAEAAVANWRRSLGPEHIDFARGLLALAHVEERCGDAELARSMLEQAGDITERRVGRSHPQALAIRVELMRLENTS